MKKQKIRKVSPVLAGIALLVMVLRFLAVVLIARRFGVNKEADIYFLAQVIPVTLAISNRQMINYAFIPVFTERNIEQGEAVGWKTASASTNLGVLFILSFTLLYVLVAPLLFHLVAPGFGPEDRILAANLSRLIAPIMVFFALFAFLEGILYTHNHYTTTSLATPLMSLGTIFGVLVLSDSLGIFGVGLGLLGGYTVQSLIPLLAARRFPRLRLFRGFDHRDEGFRTFCRQIPSVFLLQVSIIAIVIMDRTLATLQGTGGVAAFQYASTIVMILPLLIQTSLMGPLYPRISERIVRGEWDELKRLIRTFIRTIVLLMLPVTMGLMAVRVPVTQVLFERGSFTHEGTLLTASILLFLSPIILLMPLSSIFYQSFLAMRRFGVLLRLAVVFVLGNLVLCFLFMRWLGVAGIALGTTMIYVLQIPLLGYLMRREIGTLGLGALLGPAVKVLAASGMAWGCLAAGLQYAEASGWMLSNLSRAIGVALLGGAGGGVYLVACHVLRVEEVREGLAKLRSRSRATAEG